MVSKAKILQQIARVASIYCRIDYELDLSNCCLCDRGNILSNARWGRKSPVGSILRGL